MIPSENVFAHFTLSGYAKSVRHGVKHRPVSSLLLERTTGRKLHYFHRLMKKELQRRRKMYRDILYKRLAANEPLWTPRDMTPLDLLQLELEALRDNNLVLCTFILCVFTTLCNYLSFISSFPSGRS